jgi:hypothetical protein
MSTTESHRSESKMFLLRQYSSRCYQTDFYYFIASFVCFLLYLPFWGCSFFLFTVYFIFYVYGCLSRSNASTYYSK